MAEPIGIDLGTTYSLVGTLTGTGVRLHHSEMGQRSTPSVVLVDPGGVIVGEEAKHSAALRPERTFAFFKRDMGVAGAERVVDGQMWSPARLSAEVLGSLVDDVHRDTGERPSQAVVTVPAYFGDAARRATVEAAQLAGLEVLELIHEPTAAALAFGFGGRHVAARSLLVYDLGGGTFDVSLVSLGEEDMSVIATDGDHELGGKDWDDVLIEIVAERFSQEHGADPRWDPVSAADLRERCEDAKRTLSRAPQTTVNVVAEGFSGRITVTREEFEEMSGTLLARTGALVEQVLADAGVGWDGIDATVLIGGSTRMPACAALIQRLSGTAPTRGIDPDIAVVSGAALLTARHRPGARGLNVATPVDVTAGGRRFGRHARIGPGELPAPSEVRNGAAPGGMSRLPVVQDVTAHALGFVVINEPGDRYVNEVMIPRNARIPSGQAKVKRLAKGTDELDVYILQGHQERPLATESLGRYRFVAIPAVDRDRDVEISFRYDGDGIVRVGAAVGGRELALPVHDPDDRDLSWTDEDPRDHTRGKLDAVLLVDCSGSMSGPRLAEAQDACVDFAELLGALAGVRVGLVSFASGARVEATLGEDGHEVVAAARGLSTYGSTDLAAGLHIAEQVFDRPDGRRVIVLVTDGAPNDASSAQVAARSCHQHAIEIVTIGVSGADAGFLASISTADRDSLFTDDMRGALRSIARSLAGGLIRNA